MSLIAIMGCCHPPLAKNKLPMPRLCHNSSQLTPAVTSDTASFVELSSMCLSGMG